MSMLKRKKKLNEIKKNPKFYLKAKFRYVDPKYLRNQKIMRLSNEDSDYRKLIEKSRARSEKGVGYGYFPKFK